MLQIIILSLSGIAGMFINRSIRKDGSKLYIPWIYTDEKTGKKYVEDMLITEIISRTIIAWLAILPTLHQMHPIYSFIIGMSAAATGRSIYRTLINRLIESEKRKIEQEVSQIDIRIEQKEKIKEETYDERREKGSHIV